MRCQHLFNRANILFAQLFKLLKKVEIGKNGGLVVFVNCHRKNSYKLMKAEKKTYHKEMYVCHHEDRVSHLSGKQMLFG